MKHLPDAAMGFNDSNEKKQIAARVSAVVKDLEIANQARQKNKDAVQNWSEGFHAQIQSIRKQFNSVIDRLEQSAIKEMETHKTSIEDQAQTDIDKIQAVVQRLRKLFDETGGESSEVNSYIVFTQCDELIHEAQVLLHNLESQDDFVVSFEPTRDILNCLTSVNTLGKFNIGGGKRTLPNRSYMFKVQTASRHNIHVKQDTEAGGIAGMCSLPNGDFILADFLNSRLKLLDKNYIVKATYDVPNYPQDICHTGHREAAVVVYNEDVRRKILLVRARAGNLEQIKSFNLEHPCIGVSYYDGRLYVTSPTAVFVYSMSGELEKELYTVGSKNESVWKCVVSCSRVFVLDKDHHKMHVLDMDGNKVLTFTHAKLRYPCAIHVTSSSHMFASCRGTGAVLQLQAQDGKQSAVVISGKREGLSKPVSLLFNEHNTTLVIGQWGNDNIVELKLK